MILLAVLLALPQTIAQESGAIRLAPRTTEEAPVESAPLEALPSDGPRRGFDYERFETRLQSLWFQRKAFLADGADEQAKQQAELIRAFCREEGVRRLEGMASALLAETERHLANGHYNRSLDALALAESLDPGRPQIRFARADVLWQADGRNGEAAKEWFSGVVATVRGSVADLSLFRGVAMTLVVALAAMVFLFSLAMLLRYQLPFRHEIEEIAAHRFDPRLARPMGWAALLFPLFVWVLIGWAALYWLAITFRYMRRSERVVTVGLLIAVLLALPVYRSAVAVYGLTADPVVRTTLAAGDGEYDPDRIVRLRKLVDAHPEDASYRFLLAGLYKNGRFFEEAFDEYKQAIKLDPSMEQAYINIGNIFSITSQHGEAIAHYQKAIDIAPSSLLAYFNMHLAQAESFKFAEAQETLRLAREIDADRTTAMLEQINVEQRSTAIDAQLEVATVWNAALGGHRANSGFGAVMAGVGHPVGIVGLVVLVACMLLALIWRESEPARRCIRCGQAFCGYCKTTTEGHEYCTQCVHLYVLGDGLAPETKTRKLYEVEKHERNSRRWRRLISLLLPGAAQINRGRSALGALLLLAWLAAWVGARPQWFDPLRRFAAVDLPLDLLHSSMTPAVWSVSALALLSTVVGVSVWILGNGWVLKRGSQ